MRILLAFLYITFGISAMPLPSQATEWVEKKPDQLLSVVEHPDFIRSDIDHTVEYDGAWSTSEQWIFNEGSKYLSVLYTYITRHHTHLEVSVRKFKEYFEWFLASGAQSLENFERGDKAKGLMGRYWTVSYTVLDDNGNKMTNCIGTVHAWEHKTHAVAAEHLGKAYGKKVVAVYCDSNKTISDLKSTKLRQLLDSVGVKKYKTPTVAYTSQPKKKTTTTSTSKNDLLYCKRSDGSVYRSSKYCPLQITKAEYDRLKNRKTSSTSLDRDVAVSIDSPEEISISHCKDVEGEWDAIYNIFGQGVNKDIVIVDIDGEDFSIIKKYGNEYVGAGKPTLTAKFSAGKFTNILTYTKNGPFPLKYEALTISQDCRKVVLVTDQSMVTLTRPDTWQPNGEDKSQTVRKRSTDTKKLKDPEAGSLKAKLRELKDLLAEGLISEKEAAEKRAKLLEDL